MVRNDRLGDFMLAWPALALLRASLPATRIAVLVPPYTEPLARECPWLDEIIVDPGAKAPASKQRALLTALRHHNFEALLTLFSTFRVARLGLRAGIPLRVAPATKLAQLLYPVRVTQRRSRSLKPEYIYNEELARVLLQKLGIQAKAVTPPFWPLSPSTRQEERAKLASRLDLKITRPWFFIHAGSGGSANNLSLEQYSRLVQALASQLTADHHVSAPCWVLTAGPGEEPRTRQLAALLRASGVTTAVYLSEEGLAPFARSLAAADLFLAGSTGPLHVAGCLDVPTVGFFPGKRSSTAHRWRPCNSPGRTLGLQPPPDGKSTDMNRIQPATAADRIALFWRQLQNHRTNHAPSSNKGSNQ
ncbi:MAG: glycosyltransferase family 9 protein [Desulfurivibrio sp.]|nr:glycosyltransferase family 9 protein [Desulfurivibrio sp.]